MVTASAEELDVMEPSDAAKDIAEIDPHTTSTPLFYSRASQENAGGGLRRRRPISNKRKYKKVNKAEKKTKLVRSMSTTAIPLLSDNMDSAEYENQTESDVEQNVEGVKLVSGDGAVPSAINSSKDDTPTSATLPNNATDKSNASLLTVLMEDGDGVGEESEKRKESVSGEEKVSTPQPKAILNTPNPSLNTPKMKLSSVKENASEPKKSVKPVLLIPEPSEEEKKKGEVGAILWVRKGKKEHGDAGKEAVIFPTTPSAHIINEKKGVMGESSGEGHKASSTAAPIEQQSNMSLKEIKTKVNPIQTLVERGNACKH